MVKMIICAGCEKEKPHYAKGLCRKCYNREYSQKWYKENSEEYLEKQRRQHKENPEKHRGYQRKWRENNQEFLRGSALR